MIRKHLYFLKFNGELEHLLFIEWYRTSTYVDKRLGASASNSSIPEADVDRPKIPPSLVLDAGDEEEEESCGRRLLGGGSAMSSTLGRPALCLGAGIGTENSATPGCDSCSFASGAASAP